MDTDITTIENKKRKNKTWIYSILALGIIMISVWLFRKSMTTTMNTSDVRVALAEVGNIENTITAIGEVLPEYEQIMVSPISATILKSYYDPGNQVKIGDKIIELDQEETKNSFEKQVDQLELKQNEIKQLKYKLDKDLFDLKISDSVKAMKITSLKADLENARRLEKAGGGTRENVETATMNLRIAELEKLQLENNIINKQQTIGLDIKESELNAAIKEKELFEFKNKLRKANITATRNGVLTYVNRNIGAKISEGEVLARLADLHSYKVMGSISDTYADQLKVGMPAIVKINDKQLRATINNIEPSVQNNVLSFELSLDENQHELLRPKLRVEVFIITAAQSNIVRVPNGPAFKGTPVQDIFVINTTGNAERRTVKTGLSNFDFVEIKEGIKAGEKVILTDLSEYKVIREIKMK
jgi:HlyD family secretion protein